MSILDHPAGRYSTADRLAAADKLRSALADRGLVLDLIDAGELVELVTDVLPATRRMGARFDRSWTPYDEARYVEDQAIDDFAAWYETEFGR